jgi:hypothetical protein
MKWVMVVKGILAAIFVLSVAGKLSGKTKSTFEKAGLPASVMYATAFAEILFTAGLFTRFELISTLGLLGIIGGAVFTLFRQKAEPQKYVLAIIAAFLLMVVLVSLISKCALPVKASDVKQASDKCRAFHV